MIADGRPRTVTFVNDFLGQGIKRDEADGHWQNGDPHEIWYRFSGRQQAYVGNNGTIDIDYMNSVGQKQQGGPNPESYADFEGMPLLICRFRIFPTHREGPGTHTHVNACGSLAPPAR